jgi:hypothetical protein
MLERRKLPKISAARAGDVCVAFELSEQAARLLDDEVTPAEFVRKLIDAECYAEAVSLIAHALPKREAVWWSCLCARDALIDHLSAIGLTALAAAETWVYKPTEENRRAAGTAATAVATGSLAGWPAFAAFWAGPDISPQGAGVMVAPAEHMSGKAVTTAVALAAIRAEPQKIGETFRRYLAQGIDIAAGGSGRQPSQQSPRAADSNAGPGKVGIMPC